MSESSESIYYHFFFKLKNCLKLTALGTLKIEIFNEKNARNDKTKNYHQLHWYLGESGQ